ncbi:hypothetical protein EDC04DRAFT_3113611 [Pisolithus marmoratus]|nr:hypothetical protein EDC04DRAFT_3113611 [Pisolithus marmoratus]
MLIYDLETALVLFHDTSSALLVGMSLCVDLEAMRPVFSSPSKRSKNPNVDHSWVLQRKSYVWVVGYLERADVHKSLLQFLLPYCSVTAFFFFSSQDQLPIPILPVYLISIPRYLCVH